MNISTKRFEGTFLVWRIADGGKPQKKVGGRHLPRFRHETFEAAEAEAHRLVGLFPQSTFVVMQELAVVKARQPEPVE